MIMITRGLLGLALCAAMLSPAPASAQAQYEGLSFAPYEIYEAILLYADDSNFEGLEKSLKYLRPLLKYLGREYGQDLEGEIKKKIDGRDAPAVKRLLCKVILADMHLHLRAAEAPGRKGDFAERIQMAYTNYKLLSPVIVVRGGKSADAELRKAFKDLYRADDKAFISRKSAWILSALPLGFFEEKQGAL
jgi:hypothetical protein